MEEKVSIKSLLPQELEVLLAEMGEPKYRAKQIFKWLHQGVTSFDEMSDISKALRAKLDEKCFITKPEILRKQVSQLDGTIKYLFGLSDGNSIETVLMKYEHGNSICVSTQAGCKMGCVFCASYDPAKSRNLTPAEILDEILFAQKDSGRRVSNIVLMGTGEPLDNYDNVMQFLKLVSHADGVNIGMRHISLSRSGAENRRAGKIEAAADPVDLAARPQQRDPFQDHAGQSQVSAGRTDACLPQVFQNHRTSNLL